MGTYEGMYRLGLTPWERYGRRSGTSVSFASRVAELRGAPFRRVRCRGFSLMTRSTLTDLTNWPMTHRRGS